MIFGFSENPTFTKNLDYITYISHISYTRRYVFLSFNRTYLEHQTPSSAPMNVEPKLVQYHWLVASSMNGLLGFWRRSFSESADIPGTCGHAPKNGHLGPQSLEFHNIYQICQNKLKFPRMNQWFNQQVVKHATLFLVNGQT